MEAPKELPTHADDEPPKFMRTVWLRTIDELAQFTDACQTLDLGFIVTNRWVGDPTDEGTLEYEIHLYDSPPWVAPTDD